MKNLSLALNAVLFILVGVLFYLHFKSPVSSRPAQQIIQANGKSITVPQIAYINIDSFQTHYEFFKTGKAALEAKRSAMESEFGRSVSAFQARVSALQQKAQTMSEDEQMAAQQKFSMEQQQLEERKQDMEAKLLQAQNDFNTELQKKILTYIKTYNADGRYTYILPYIEESMSLIYVNEGLNITDDVVKGMNEEYKKEKK